MFQSTPVLSHLVEEVNGPIYWVTLQDRIGLTVECWVKDLEEKDIESWIVQVSTRGRDLSPNVLLRVRARTEVRDTVPLEDFSRKRDIEKTGYVYHGLIISLETGVRLTATKLAAQLVQYFRSNAKQGGEFEAEMSFLKEQFRVLDLRGLGLEPRMLHPNRIQELFSYGEVEAVPTSFGVDLGSSAVGVVRLSEVLASVIPLEHLPILREALPKPYDIVLTAQRLDETKVDLLLAHYKKAVEDMPDPAKNEKYAKILEAQRRAESREAFFKLEYSIVLSRTSEASLRADLAQVSREFSAIGKWSVETISAFPCWKATLEGSKQHVPLPPETVDALAVFAPLVVRGNSLESNEMKQGSLGLHRLDGSLYCYHQYGLYRQGGSPRNNANILVIGRPNSGKSALLSLKTKALFKNPNHVFIKGDAGGSYWTECRELGGVMYEIAINQPSGLNSFQALQDMPHDAFLCSVLAGLIKVLIQEKLEKSLSKDMSADVERAVIAYSLSRPKDPSMDDFITYVDAHFSDSFPRLKILKRWGKGQMYQNFFKPIEDASRKRNRYRCYNLKSIEQGEDEDFIQGVNAALLVDYNIEIALMDSPDKRINLEIDEARTAINRCGSLLQVKGANNRKQGGSLTLITQNSSWVSFQGEDGKNDDGLFNLADSHWLFTMDGDEEVYQRRHRLEGKDIQTIKNFSQDVTTHRDVLVSDSKGTRVLRISLSHRELWTVGSNKDRTKALTDLMTAVPGLTEEEAITCLAKDFY